MFVPQGVPVGAPTSRSAGRAIPNLRPPFILIVDDETDVRETLHDFLRLEFPRARVLVAEGSAGALEVVAEHRIDLVLADYRMPRSNGLDLLTALHQSYPRIGRVLFTAYPETELAIDAVNQAKIHAFLRKPIEAGELVATVERILRERRARWWRDEALRRAVRVGQDGGHV